MEGAKIEKRMQRLNERVQERDSMSLRASKADRRDPGSEHCKIVDL